MSKYIHILGWVLWGVIAYFGFSMVNSIMLFVSELGLFWKILIQTINFIIFFFGIYRIIFSIILLVDVSNTKLFQILLAYAIIGLLGLVLGFVKPLYIVKESVVDMSIYGTAILILFWNLVLLPLRTISILLKK